MFHLGMWSASTLGQTQRRNARGSCGSTADWRLRGRNSALIVFQTGSRISDGVTNSMEGPAA